MTTSAEKFLIKAKQAQQSAQGLHFASDADGSCNRAYYAVFNAARAVLTCARLDAALEHASLSTDWANAENQVMDAFSAWLLELQPISWPLKSYLFLIRETRNRCDFLGENLTLDVARQMFEHSHAVLEFVHSQLSPPIK